MNSEKNSLSSASANTIVPAHCMGRVWDGWRHVSCGKRATRDGWCGIHHPDAVAARRARVEGRHAEKRDALNAKWAAEKEQRRRAECFDDLLRALTNLYALVIGECPSLLEDDHHAEMVRAAIAKAEASNG